MKTVSVQNLTRGEHVVVGLSGGVDSAVTAARAVAAGCRVTGLFMKNWEGDDTLTRCGAEDDYATARQVADHLGIELRFINFAKRYREQVFEPALRALRAGETPNPDILCNRHVKFRAFLDHAIGTLGADRIATGHYAQAVTLDGIPALYRGIDADKDQSYFLHAIPADALARSAFPLGALTKAEVRAEARALGLPNHDRPDSTGICFIGERDFAGFIADYVEESPGPILAADGRRMGTHRGLAFHTLGQRRGLGIGGAEAATGAPWYVAGKDPARNVLWVVQGHDHPWLQCSGAEISDPLYFPEARPEPGEDVEVQVRYRQAPEPARVTEAGEHRLGVRFHRPLRAVTPGQSLVIYRGNRCLGGGVIRTAAPLTAAPTEPAPAVASAAGA